MAEHKVKDYPHYTTNKALKTQVSAGSREEGYERVALQGRRLQVMMSFPMRRYKGAPIDVWCMSCYVIRNEPLLAMDKSACAGVAYTDR